MVSNQVLKSVIMGVKETVGLDVCIFDENASVVVSTFTPEIARINEIEAFINSRENIIEKENYCFLKDRFVRKGDDFVIYMRGEKKDLHEFAKLISFSLKQLFVAYDSKTVINEFLNNLFRNNILPINLENEARLVGINPSTPRGLIIVASKEENLSKLNETLKDLFKDVDDVYISSFDREYFVLIFQAKEEENVKEMSKWLLEKINEKEDLILRITYGKVADTIHNILASYNQAKICLLAIKTFYPNKKISSYAELGLLRLIFSLSDEECEIFLKEHFTKEIINQIDEKTLETVNAFLDNSLNLTETARNLLIHRNTIIYRLNKLEKITGLDVRKLDDAIKFKISIMVYKKCNASKL